MPTIPPNTPQEIVDNLVDVGFVANDGTGDTLRDSFLKINGNFLYVGSRLGNAVTGTNIGSTGEGIYKEVVSSNLKFRKIDADGNLHIRLVGDVITLEFKPNSAVDFHGQAITNAGAVTATSFSGPLTGNVTGSVSGNAGSVTNGVYTTGDQTIAGNKTFSSTISGSVTGNAGTVTNGVYTTGNQNIDGFKTFLQPIHGLLSGNVTGYIRSPDETAYVDVSDLERRINTFDYGVINPVFVDPISYYLYATGTDMGTFNNPSEFGIDAGTI
jgi:hypothetical protein